MSHTLCPFHINKLIQMKNYVSFVIIRFKFTYPGPTSLLQAQINSSPRVSWASIHGAWVLRRSSGSINEAIGATCANETLQLNWGH